MQYTKETQNKVIDINPKICPYIIGSGNFYLSLRNSYIGLKTNLNSK